MRSQAYAAVFSAGRIALLLSSAVLAQQPSVEDPELLFQRIKARAAEHLAQLPNYTCHETINRMRRARSTFRASGYRGARSGIRRPAGAFRAAWGGQVRGAADRENRSRAGRLATARWARTLISSFRRTSLSSNTQERARRMATRLSATICACLSKRVPSWSGTTAR